MPASLPPFLPLTTQGMVPGWGTRCPASLPGASSSWGAITWSPLSQVNGILPILPLLFPVLWVLATACGEARVLAQMSKASPSSLVGVSQASGAQGKKKKEQEQRGVCRVLVNRSGWADAWALPRPSRLQALPWGSQQMGFRACPVSFIRGVGSLAGMGPSPASSEAFARGQFPAECHPLFSMQLAKFSEDTLSSYTEAVSAQVRSPGRMLPQVPSGTLARPALVTFQPPVGSQSRQPRLSWAVCH